jgi:hypothetical protein
MPIRFRCQRCHQLLGIASRKAGSHITCPRCGLAQAVPGKGETAETGSESRSDDTSDMIHIAADSASAGQAVVAGSLPHDSSGEDIPDLAAVPSMAAASRGETAPTAPAPPSASAGHGAGASAPIPLPPAAPATSDPAPSSISPGPAHRAPRPPTVERSDRGVPVPSDMILFPRRVLYVQAVLYVVLAAAFLGLGYFIGRGDIREERQAEKHKREQQTIYVDGKVVYNPGTGRIAGDEGAVVIVLPAEYSGRRLSVNGMRPGDPLPQESHETLDALKNLGGAYTRADASGAFSLLVPDRGKYRVLIISRHANRPKDQPVDEVDLNQMDKYFGDGQRGMAEELIHQSKYSWKTEEIAIGFKGIFVDFGLDGQK